MAVGAVLPRVGRHLVGPADPPRCENDGPGRKDHRLPAVAPVSKCARNAAGSGQQMADGALHVHVDIPLDRLVLQRPDHLQAGPVADVGKSRVGVAAEGPLGGATVPGSVEDRPPQLELADPLGGLHGMQLRHARVVQQLAADHRVPEMHLPAVIWGDMRERRGHAALRHHGVCLPEQRLAHQAHAGSARLGFDGGPQARPTGADHEHVVDVGLELADRHDACRAPRSEAPGRRWPRSPGA